MSTPVVAVISGAARGLGQAFARKLAAEDKQLVLVDVLPCEETLAALPGEGHTSIVCDISSPEAVDQLRQHVEKAHGHADVLVNNAGVYPPMPFHTLTFDQWRHVQAINVDGALLLSLALSPGMRQQGWGRIVNLGSTITRSQSKDLLPYLVSKAAVHGLTRALANELGEYGITVNAIAPSIVPTAGVQARAGGIQGLTTEQEVAMVSSGQTIKRVSTEQDLVGTLSFLVSDDAEFITGQIIYVDGGMTRSGG